MRPKILKNSLPQIYFILDPEAIRGETVASAARAAIRAGIRIIQYRDKTGPAGRMLKNARILRRLTREHGVTFIINDRTDIALACGSDGVHLGQDDLPVAEARKILGPDKIIGLSVTSLAQVRRAQKTSADQLGIGPIFATPAKPKAKTLGLKNLARAVKISKKPLVAIGGLNQDNICEVLQTGVKMAAVRGAFRRGQKLYPALLELKKGLTGQAGK